MFVFLIYHRGHYVTFVVWVVNIHACYWRYIYSSETESPKKKKVFVQQTPCYFRFYRNTAYTDMQSSRSLLPYVIPGPKVRGTRDTLG